MKYSEMKVGDSVMVTHDPRGTVYTIEKTAGFDAYLSHVTEAGKKVNYGWIDCCYLIKKEAPAKKASA